MESIKNLWQKLHKVWNEAEKKTRILVAIIGGTIVIALILLFTLTGRTSYAPLYTNINAQDAHMIMNALDKMGVHYKLDGEGKSILVSREQVHRLRLQLAGEGIPQGGTVGFEIFDTNRLGTTEFERQINFYRALAGELSRTIMEIDSIDTARVQLTVPRQKLFIVDEEPVEASVLLKLHKYQVLKHSQIEAIAHLVAGSVEGLEPQKVTIIDTEGNLLSHFMSNKESVNPFGQETTVKNFEMQRVFEQQLQRDLEQMLLPVLGFNNYVVKVNASLDFGLREETEKIYIPSTGERGIIRSQQIMEESSTGSQSVPGGVPGTDSNIPFYDAAADETQSAHEAFESITNYEINEKIISHVYAPGNVERISVGVIVNRPLEPEQLADVREAVAAAIGYNEGRGDSLHITQLSFDDSLKREMEALAAGQEAQARQKFFLTLGIIVAGLLAVLYLIRYLSKTYGKRDESVVLFDEEPDQPEIELTSEEIAWQKVKQEVSNLIDDSPEEAANLLKVWLLED